MLSNIIEKKDYKERLINLIIDDMKKSDITSLILYGFKGLTAYTIDELEHSVVDRYNIHEKDIFKLTKLQIKGNKNG